MAATICRSVLPSKTGHNAPSKKRNIIMKIILAIGAAALLCAAQAQAHVGMLAPDSVSRGQSFKAVIAVPHGCEGSATTAIKIHIPEGIIAVKPQPKAGWRISKSERAYAQAYDYYGTQLKQGVNELTWQGRLGDDEYDEFVFKAYAAAIPAGTDKLYFKLEQQCENGRLLWTDVSGQKINGHAAAELGAPYIAVKSDAAAVHHH